MISPVPAKIGDILGSSVQFCVPNYQRPYTWGKTEALELIEDLGSYSGTADKKLFLGNFIFDSSEEGQKKFKIIDGQQRITTIILLLNACRLLARKINKDKLADKIQEKISFVDDTTGKSTGPKLVVSDSIADIFEYISSDDWKGDFPLKIDKKSVKRQVNRIQPVFDYFKTVVQKFDFEKLSQFLRAIYDAYVVRIDIKDEVEAFSIFERTNARGVDLEVSDLLKNYFFSQQINDIEDDWKQIAENAGGTMLRMLKYFYVSRKGLVPKTDLYRNIRDYSKLVGVGQLLEELKEFSIFYNMARCGTEDDLRKYFIDLECDIICKYQDRYQRIYVALQGLRFFNVTQIYPLIFSAIKSFTEDKNRDKAYNAFISFFEILEKYHFVNNAVCDRVGNEVEKMYADYCKKYFSSNDFVGITKEFKSELKKKAAAKSEFVARFVDISYEADSIPLIVYIFDRINNFGLDPAQSVKMFNPDTRLLRKNHNIEHFYPQTPMTELKSKLPMGDSDIHNIGNLLVLYFKTNGRLNNLSPEDKVKKLKNEFKDEIKKCSYMQEFLKTWSARAAKWDKKLVAKRAKLLAEQAYSKFWAF